ncbi:MAG: bifunctional ornithine acetyltransferase/N-acetylglutamate synthase [Methanobacteriaceae archaeon]|jgi:glutamate N-acetyltransferase/amino-acid N-acetyltransferase|nr:bifunctional ornithine acetyltransferase/N-acetylglutamate synthase [Methanobacteriaceae archaeon]
MKIRNLENIKAISGGICSVEGVDASGTRYGKYGVSIISNLDSNASAVFTSNKIKAAPIEYTEKIIKNGKLSLIIANSGNANCFTGKEGMDDCLKMVDFASQKLNIPPNLIATASTGVIGRKMPMDILLNLEEKSIKNLNHSSKSSTAFAKGIMTTDTVSKEFAVEVTLTNNQKVKIGGVTKGTGMIAPNMGTMLSFLVTDAKLSAEEINKSLKIAVDNSFNMIVVDGDESTNDIAILMANGKSNCNLVDNGKIDSNFQKGLNYLCQELAQMMVRDGEGASKFLEVTVKGAKSENDARNASKSVISSSLFKSAVFGGDPNWGRIAAAIGYSGVSMKQDKISISIKSKDLFTDLVKDGIPLAFDGSENLTIAEKIMENNEIEVIADLNIGEFEATSWGCDLTYDYVKINAEYTT